jgi:predicted permease
MDDLLRDLKYALRNLGRNPGFTLLAIATLALGIGANTAIFSVVHAVVLKPLPYPQPERLVFISSQFPNLGFHRFWVSVPEFLEFRDHNKAFASVGGYRVQAANLGIERPVRPPTALVTHGLLATLGVTPLRGRDFTEDDTRPGAEDVAILSFKLWQAAFAGAEDVIGRVVEVDAVKTRIVGIMPEGFDVHDERVELYLPLTIDPANPGSRGGHFLYLIGRLREGVTLEQARTDLERLLTAWPKPAATAHAPNTKGHRLQFEPLQEDVIGSARAAVWVLQAAVGFVLLIACANLASLLLARTESRQREFALRAALGAGRVRLLGQFLAEGLVLSLAGGAAGLAFAVLALRAILRTTTTGSIPRLAEIGLDPTVLLFTLAVALVTGVVFGLVPLLRLGKHDLHSTLKEAGARATASPVRRRARGLLVVAEVALAVVLVVGAGLMLRTFWNLMTVDAGFDREGLVTFRVVLPGTAYPAQARPAFFRRLIDQLAAVPGVRSVAAMSGLPPLREVNANDTDFEDIVPVPQGEGQQPQGPIENVDYYQMVTHEYAKTMGIPVLEGRSFESSDVAGAPVAMVNETLVRTFFPNRSAIGRRLRVGPPTVPWITIVGVLKDVKQGGVGEETGTELYLLADQLPRFANFGVQEMNIVLRTGLPTASIAGTIQKTVGSMDASLPIVGLRQMQDVFAEALSRPRFLAVLLAVFAGLALLLAAVGAYGILSYLVAERQQEIGIRMALGAGRPSVLGMVLGQGMMLAAAGLAVGLVAALALTRVLDSLLFGVEPYDPVTLLAGVVFMGLVAAAACLMPAYRATSVDPIIVLRAE